MTRADFDLNDAQLFAKVVEKGSFSGAARLLGLPVSSVSRKVARLEEQLGSRLLHRTTRKLSLTDAGRTYHDMVSSALEQLHAAAAAVSGLQAEPSGRIRFTSVPGLSRYAWGLVEEFLARYPKVSIEMDLTERTVDMIEGGYDLALRAGQLPDSSLVSRKLMTTSFGLMATPAYLDAHGRPATLDDLAEHECVVFGLSLRGAQWRLQQGRKTKEVPIRGRLAITDLEAVVQACLRGLGIAMLPLQMTELLVARGELERVLADWSGPTGGLYLVYPSRRHLSPSVRAFMDYLAENFDREVMRSDRIYEWLRNG